MDLPEPQYHPVVWDEKIYKPKQEIYEGELMSFVETAHVNDPTKRTSSTGFDYTFSGSAVVYRYKYQLINALSSTEAEIISAVTAANTASFLRSMFCELGFP